MRSLVSHFAILTVFYSLLRLQAKYSISLISTWVISILLTLSVSALMKYTVDWKENLKPKSLSNPTLPFEKISLERDPPLSKKANKQKSTELSSFQMFAFTPLAFIYLSIRLFWLYFRMGLYYLVDAGFAFSLHTAQILTSIEWIKNLTALQDVAYRFIVKFEEAVIPILTQIQAHFPSVYYFVSQAIVQSVCSLSFLALWLKRVFWTELFRPVVDEILKGLLKLWCELQPELLRFKILLFRYASFITCDIVEEFKVLFDWAVFWFLKMCNSIDYKLIMSAVIYVSVTLVKFAKAVFSLHELDFKFLLEMAKKRTTHHITTEIVDVVLVLPQVFSLLLLWEDVFYNMWTEQVPKLLLNILVWLIEDVLIPGTALLISAHKSAWESSRAAYLFCKRASFNIMEVLYLNVIIPFQNVLESVQAYFVRTLPVLTVCVDYVKYALSLSLSQISAIYSRLLVYMDPISRYCMMLSFRLVEHVRQNLIPRLITSLDIYQKKLELLEIYRFNPENESTNKRNVTLFLAPYTKFLANELQSALASINKTFETWIDEQTPEPALKRSPPKIAHTN